MEIDLEVVSFGVRPHHDLLDQAADVRHCRLACAIIVVGFHELAQRFAIARAHAGFDQAGLGLNGGEFGLKAVAFLDRRIEVGFDLACLHGARADSLNQLVALGDGLGEIVFER